MKQYRAVQLISEAILLDGMAQALFLKGSLARQEEDQYSDVDFYVVVSEDNLLKFLDKRLDYLRSYAPILHHFEENFVAPQIVCIFEDGLHFDFFVTTKNQINHFDNISIIFDPHNLLGSYKKSPLNLSNQEIAGIINSFCFTAIEFYAAYNRQDFLFAFRLSHLMFGDLGKYLRSIVDPDYAKIGLKRFYAKLEEPYKTRYLEIAKKISFDNSLISIKMMFVLFDSLIMSIPIRIAEHVNFEFFQYSKKLIMGME
ncbi:MAG: hypothetical protein AB7V00_02055 [Bacilli bacterium]